MTCDTRIARGQTPAQRKKEIAEVVQDIAKGIATGKIKPVVGAQGGITFEGLLDATKRGVTDSCIYRRLLASGSATALMAIEKAERMAGRKVDRKAGVHAHSDGQGGITWHPNHK